LELSKRIRVRPEEPPLLVAEKGSGRPIGARGEIPYRLVPGENYEYADLSGPGGRFGTLDYSDTPPTLYLGKEIALDELNLPHREESPATEPRRVAAVQVSCPNCGGSLELHAPDATERVGCPYCGSMLDATEGNLKILQAANGGPIKIPLPLGSKGKFDGVEYIVIGYMLRGIRMEGVLYTWSEYLLYHEKKGFRWLEHSDNHWSFIETLPPGAVGMRGNNACYDDKTFRWFQRGEARVKAVAGEFYWKVSVGERVFTSDYVLPPESLSREYTEYGENQGEINWSHGRYLQVREVEQAFGLKESLPRPSTIAPSQPFPYSGIYWYGAAFAITTILLGIIFFITGRRSTVFENTYEIAPTAAQATAEGGNVFFTRSFALHDNQNVEITASAESTNFWLGIDGDLVEEKTGVVQGFSTSVEYYAGVDEGEAWSEGGKESSVCVSALPEGEYSLRLEVFGEPRNPPLTLHVRVRQNVPRFSHWFMALLAVTAIPLAVVGYNIYFESCRWRDSNVVSGEGGDGDDD
jgi:ribosomal protein S27E